MAKLVATLFLLVGLFSTPAWGFEIDSKWQCSDTNTLKENLRRYGEEVFSTGAIHGQDRARFLMSLWTNPATGTWTLVATVLENNNISCVMGFGTAFTAIRPKNTI